jgi:hypothetical protein
MASPGTMGAAGESRRLPAYSSLRSKTTLIMTLSRSHLHRIDTSESPPRIAARLEGLLSTELDWNKPLALSAGDRPQFDEQSFRFRIAGNKFWSFLVVGTIGPSGLGHEITFEIVPRLEHPWLIGLSTAAPIAVMIWGFWPISPALALGAAVVMIVSIGAVLVLGWLAGRWWARRSILKALSPDRVVSRESSGEPIMKGR